MSSFDVEAGQRCWVAEDEARTRKEGRQGTVGVLNGLRTLSAVIVVFHHVSELFSSGKGGSCAD